MLMAKRLGFAIQKGVLKTSEDLGPFFANINYKMSTYAYNISFRHLSQLIF